MKKQFLLVLFLMSLLTGMAQNGFIKGLITQKVGEKFEAVYPANVVLLAHDGSVAKGVRTDFEGKYLIEFHKGHYKIRVSSPGMAENVFHIHIHPGDTIRHDVILESLVKDQKEVVVVGIRTKTTDATVVEEIKNDLGVKSSMGSEQISSTGAGDTKEVLSKMSGVSSSQSGGVIFVRGMGDRYNAAYLNGLPLVSPNPELRVMPMDIIPTSIIDVLDVSKLMSPNLYGDFAGGAINIRTKKVFRTPTLNVSLGSNMNTQITGKDFTGYKGGKMDFLGIDDGTRALPDAVKSVSMKRADQIYTNGLYNSKDANIGTGFLNDFNKQSKTALPGTNFKIEGGNYFKSKKEGVTNRGFGFLTMLSHSTSYQKQLGTARYINAQNKLEYNFDMQSDVFSTSTVGLASLLFDYSKKSSFNLNYLMMNNTEDNTTQSWGYHRDYNDGGQELYGRRNAYSQNLVNIIQLVGDQKFLEGENLKLSWGTSYSFSKNVVPDRKQITGLYTDRNDLTHYNLLALDANHTHRFFSNLDEKELAAHADINWNLFENKALDTVLNKMDLLIGFDYKNKNRTFNFRQFNYLAKPLADMYTNNFDINNPDNYLNDDNLNAGLFKIEESANPGNGYTASQNVIGSNAGINYQINRKFEIVPNIRMEIGEQSVINRKQTQASVKEVNIINSIDLMPSLALKYETKSNQFLRIGASKTLIRPKFFEVAPFEYLAQVVGMTQIGNPKLQNSTNYNLDIRYEIYTPKSADMLIFGVFGKQLINPIEQVLRPSASGQIISFDNTKNGTVAGAEIEYAKSLVFLTSKSKRADSKLKNYYISGNVAYIYSRIDMNDTTGFTTNPIRPLQGASPYLANITFKYEKSFDKLIDPSNKDLGKKSTKIMSGLSFSYSSKTLYVVGIQGVGDQYLFPTYLLNWTNKITFNNDLAIAFTFRNLLNTRYQIFQVDMVNKGDWQSVNSFRKGVDFQFSLSYSILKAKKR